MLCTLAAYDISDNSICVENSPRKLISMGVVSVFVRNELITIMTRRFRLSKMFAAIDSDSIADLVPIDRQGLTASHLDRRAPQREY